MGCIAAGSNSAKSASEAWDAGRRHLSGEGKLVQVRYDFNDALWASTRPMQQCRMIIVFLCWFIDSFSLKGASAGRRRGRCFWWRGALAAIDYCLYLFVPMITLQFSLHFAPVGSRRVWDVAWVDDRTRCKRREEQWAYLQQVCWMQNDAKSTGNQGACIGCALTGWWDCYSM